MKSWRKHIRRVLSVALSLVLLWISFRGVDWKVFVRSLSSCDWWYLLLSAAVGAVMPACRAFRWRHMVLPFAPRVGRKESVLANFTAYLFNMAVPYTHEATRCIIIHRSESGRDAPYDKLVGVAVTERICDGICAILILIATIAFSWERYGGFIAGNSEGRGIIKVLVVFTVLILAAVVADLATRRMKAESRIIQSVRKFFDGMHEGLTSIFNLERPIVFTMETVVLWIIYWLQLYLASRAVPGLDGVGALDCLFLTLGGLLSTIIPVPGGMGAYHYVIASALAYLCGTGWSEGMAFATLVHESQAICMMLLGASSIALLPSSVRKRT
jgi:hypothetical protein